MTEVVDENSINTELTFESGDENVNGWYAFKLKIKLIHNKESQQFQFQDDIISITSTSNTDTTSRSRSGTPTNKVPNGNKRGRKKAKTPKVVKCNFKYR